MNEEWNDYAQFKDTIHGYIKIHKPIVKEIINDPRFQRLKHIEQTGMGVLYPSATHNRFVHSLGVYHLGDMAFHSFIRNIRSKYKEDCYELGPEPAKGDYTSYDKHWAHWEILFKLACLLHDIGHTPFSHSLENIYNLDSTDILEGGHNDSTAETAKRRKINKNLIIGNDSAFGVDFNYAQDNYHEKMGAYLIQTEFKEKIKKLVSGYMRQFDDDTSANNNYPAGYNLRDDLEFMVRMVIGCHYNPEKAEKYARPNTKTTDAKWESELQLRNCVIGLLNSSIDVDNLDYTSRDTKISGYENTHVDIERLVNAFSVIEGYKYNNDPVKFDCDCLINNPVTCKEFTGKVKDLNIDGTCKMEALDGKITAKGRLVIWGEDEDEDENTEKELGLILALPGFSANISCENIRITPLPPTPSEKAKARLASDKAYLYLSGGEIDGTLNGNIYGKINIRPNMPGLNVKKLYRSAFEKSCLSVIDGAVLARNYERRWIYAHHTITYQTNFLVFHLLDCYCAILHDDEKRWIADKFLDKLNNWEPAGQNGGDDADKNPEDEAGTDNIKKTMRINHVVHKLIEAMLDGIEDNAVKADINKKNSTFKKIISGSDCTIPDMEDVINQIIKSGENALDSMVFLRNILDIYCKCLDMKEQNRLSPPCEELVCTLLEWVYALYKAYFEKNLQDWREKGEDLILYFLQKIQEMCLTPDNDTKCLEFSKLLKTYELIKNRFMDGGMQYMVDVIGVPSKKTIDDKIYYYTSDSDLYALYKEKNMKLTAKSKNNGEGSLTPREKEFCCIANESFSRQFAHGMWKTYAEYTHLFRVWTEKERNELLHFFHPTSTPPSIPTSYRPGEDSFASDYFVLSENNMENIRGEREVFFDTLKTEFQIDRFIYVPQIIKTKSPDIYHTYFNFNRDVLRLADIDLFKTDETEKKFCYFYYFCKDKEKRLENIDIVRIIDILHLRIIDILHQEIIKKDGNTK
jgi:HD superfamily phosphohydrolase